MKSSSTSYSPPEHFGERMAIYWLDLVRYADTGGYHSDNAREVDAFRDYVIKAFNQNSSRSISSRSNNSQETYSRIRLPSNGSLQGTTVSSRRPKKAALNRKSTQPSTRRIVCGTSRPSGSPQP